MLRWVQYFFAFLALACCVQGEAEKDDDVPVNSIPLKLFNHAGSPVSPLSLSVWCHGLNVP
jgi:hypothetical protein